MKGYAIDMIVVRHRGPNGGKFLSNGLILQLGDQVLGFADAAKKTIGINVECFPKKTVTIKIRGKKLRTDKDLKINSKTGAASFNRTRYKNKLSSREWSRFYKTGKLKKGVNHGKFHIKGLDPIPFKVFLYNSTDRLVFTDVDGTITGSDAGGHAAYGLNTVYNHAGVEKFFRALDEKGYKIVYLTARSIDMINCTKSYLFEMSKLPQGPLLCSEEQLVTSFYTEMMGKIGSKSLPEMKKRIVLSVVRNFVAKFNPKKSKATTRKIVAGAYGNRTTDRVAYSAAGVSAERIWIIGKKSLISKRSELKRETPKKTFKNGYVAKLKVLGDYYKKRRRT